MRFRWSCRTVACPRDGGQATVEFALVLPLVVFALLSIIQVGLVVSDHITVVHAAREAARAAAVERDPERAVIAARRVLRDASVSVGARPAVGQAIAVDVQYRSRTNLPMVGLLFPDPMLHARAVMRVER